MMTRTALAATVLTAALVAASLAQGEGKAPAPSPAAAGGTERAAAKTLGVLILSGKSNHDWRQTTPVLQKMLSESGRFTVDVTENPASLDAARLAKYDVILSNWNNWPDVNARVWGEKAEKAVLDFVRSGKGFVTVHAGSSSFYTWPEYQEMVGAWWDLKKTGHGPVHKFTVRIADREHPVMRGMTDFETTDELWEQSGMGGQRRVLCTSAAAKDKGGSGAEEPLVHSSTFGKGRSFTILLGHDAAAMKNAGFQTLVLRGTEWAATGEVTIPIPASLAAAGAGK